MATTDTTPTPNRRRRRGARRDAAAADSADVTTVDWHDDGRTGDPPRRTMPVAHVLVVGVIALLIGALLNAPGIRKTALGQDVGWRRDVSTFFADRLYDVSHAIFLDRPRELLQDAIGRGGDDDIDLSLPSPTTPPTTNPEAEPEPKRAFSPTDQVAMYVTGDSLAQTPGESVINQGLGTGVIGLLGPVDSHVATGLARPEVFNWPAYLEGVVAATKPDALVLSLGSNDDQSLTGDGGGQSFGTPEWVAEYRRRVGGLMDALTANGETTIFWIGIPPMANAERFDTRYTLINTIVREEAERRPGKVVFVDTVPILSAFGGGYAEYLPLDDGTLVQVRSADGIHFTRAGGDRIASKVLEHMYDTFDLESWQDVDPSTTSTSRPPRTTTSSRDGRSAP